MDRTAVELRRAFGFLIVIVILIALSFRLEDYDYEQDYEGEWHRLFGEPAPNSMAVGVDRGLGGVLRGSRRVFWGISRVLWCRLEVFYGTGGVF